MRSDVRVRCRVALFLSAVLVTGAILASPVRGEKPAPAAPAKPEPPPAASAPAAAPGPETAQQPVTIKANAAEYLDQENKVVFKGKVVAVQGDATLTAEQMDVVFTPKTEAPAASAGSKATTQAESRIRSIVATRNVTFRQVDPETKKERYGVGERADYDAAAKVLTLTGNPRVWEGKNVMTGEKMLFFLESHRVQVEGKVNLTVYPDEVRSPEKTKKP